MGRKGAADKQMGLAQVTWPEGTVVHSDGIWNTVGPTRLGNSAQQAVTFSGGQPQGRGWGKLAKGQSKRSEMAFWNTPETTQEARGT